MTTPQEQFTELTRRTQENFKHLWEQWSQPGFFVGVTGVALNYRLVILIMVFLSRG